MKKLFLLLAILASSYVNAQCLITKCINEGGGVIAQNLATGAPFDNTFTIVWTATPAGFTGQGTNTIDWVSISPTPGIFNGSYTVTNGLGCDTTITFCIEVIQPTPPTLNLPSICTNGAPIAITGGFPTGGVYTDANGAVLTEITSALIGQSVNYTIIGANGCNGSATDIVIGLPSTPPTLNLPDICTNGAPLAITGGSPTGGVYTDSNGVVLTEITSSLIGQSVNYTTIGANGCNGSITDIVIGLPSPNGAAVGF